MKAETYSRLRMLFVIVVIVFIVVWFAYAITKFSSWRSPQPTVEGDQKKYDFSKMNKYLFIVNGKIDESDCFEVWRDMKPKFERTSGFCFAGYKIINDRNASLEIGETTLCHCS